MRAAIGFMVSSTCSQQNSVGVIVQINSDLETVSIPFFFFV
jgi:hypothetical protein